MLTLPDILKDPIKDRPTAETTENVWLWADILFLLHGLVNSPFNEMCKAIMMINIQMDIIISKTLCLNLGKKTVSKKKTNIR